MTLQGQLALFEFFFTKELDSSVQKLALPVVCSSFLYNGSILYEIR